MISGIDTTFVATDNNEVIPFKALVIWYRGGVSTMFVTGEAIPAGILKLTGRPYDMFGFDGSSAGFQVEEAFVLGDFLYIDFFLNR